MACCKKPPIRLWVAVMIFFAVFITYWGRLHVSILIVAMVRSKSKTKKPPPCDPNKNMNVSAKQYPGIQYPWSETIQGQILAAYAYGFIVTNIIGGLLAELYGPYKVILWSNLASALLISVTSFSARAHWSLVIVFRALLGLMGGVLYPAVQSLLANWAPPAEKGKFVALLMGNSIGSIVILPLMGWVATAFNYDVAFVVVAAVFLIFCIVFAFVTSDTPADHRCISEEEREYILTAQGGTVTTKKKPIPPYKKLLTSIPMWAAIIAHFGNMWGLFFQMTMVPKFLAEVMGFELKKAGAISALPYVARFLSGIAFGALGDFIKKRELMSTTVVRKSFTVSSHIIPGVIMSLIIVTKCNYYAAIAMLVTSLMFNGAVVLTNLQNPHDLAPNFAGTIYGIMQTAGGLSGFLAPAITSALIKNESTIERWIWAFVIGAIIYVSSGIIFIIFGSGKLQSFNEIQEREDKEGTAV